MLVDDSGSEDGNNKSLANVLRSTESNILGASKELKEIVIESGHMAESLFERVNDGYHELTVSQNTTYFYTPIIYRMSKYSTLLIIEFEKRFLGK